MSHRPVRSESLTGTSRGLSRFPSHPTKIYPKFHQSQGIINALCLEFCLVVPSLLSFLKKTLQQRLEDLLKTGWSLRLPTMSHFGSSSKGRMEKKDTLKTPAATDLPVCPIEMLLGSINSEPRKPMIFHIDNAQTSNSCWQKTNPNNCQ